MLKMKPKSGFIHWIRTERNQKWKQKMTSGIHRHSGKHSMAFVFSLPRCNRTRAAFKKTLSCLQTKNSFSEMVWKHTSNVGTQMKRWTKKRSYQFEDPHTFHGVITMSKEKQKANQKPKQTKKHSQTNVPLEKDETGTSPKHHFCFHGLQHPLPAAKF